MPLIIPSNSQSASGYTIDQSIRFPWASITSGGYMYRTPSGAGDRTSWTWSCWFKLGGMNGFTPASNYYYYFFAVDNATNDAGRGSLSIKADSGNSGNYQFLFAGHSTAFMETSQVFRDPSAWMHLVLVWDSDNTVSSERARLYINGERVTSFGTLNNPSSGQEIGFNLAAEHRIAGSKNISSGALNYPWDGYMADIHFLDGYSYGPEYFGETNSSGLWIPKEYDGSYGSNGFKIDGRDSADLGDDESGNGNDFSTTSMGTHDQVSDSPSNNFAVTNAVNSHSNITLSEGNLKEVNSGTSIAYGSSSTISLTSGKWYVEWRLNTLVSNEYPVVGLYSTNKGRGAMSTSYNFPGLNYPGSGYNDIGFGANNGNRFEDNTTSSWGNGYANGNIAALAIDMDNKKIWFGHNNSGSFVWQVSGNPAAGSNEANTKAFASDVVVGVGHYSSSSVTFNYGQDGTFGGTETAQGNSDGNGVGNFYYAPPSGFLAICTKNLGS